LSPGEKRLFLGVIGSLTFASVYGSIVMAPLLTQLAGEFSVSTGTAGLVAAAYGGPGIITALLTGPYSDRFGRKRFLVAGALIMGVFTLLSAFATSFEMLVAMRGIAGIGGSLIFPNANAIVADVFAYRERGRAMSMVIGFNTMGSVIGVPVSGIVAEATSWRVSVGIVGILSLAAAAGLVFFLRPVEHTANEGRIWEMYQTILRNGSAIAAIISSCLGQLFWFTWATYVVVFFQQTHSLSLGTASTYSLTLGLGVLLGSQVGGRLGDRVGHRPIAAGTVLVGGILLLALTNLPVTLVGATALNLLLAAVVGARFATNSSLLGELVPEARGTVFAFVAATASLSIVAGATIGGVLVDTVGFGAMGVFCCAAAVLSSILVQFFVREEPLDLDIATA
jgi:predicted MFS family arabinose efflux permease